MDLVNPILGRPTRARTTRFSHGDWTVVQCTETDFVFLKDPPAYDQLESEFAWETTSAQETQRRWKSEPHIKVASLIAYKIKRRLRPTRNRFFDLAKRHVTAFQPTGVLNVLDVGCGGGSLLQKLHDRFQLENRTVVPHGIEVSHHLAKIASQCVEALGGRVIQENALAGMSQFGPGHLDLVIMSSFLEHESKPLELLKEIHEVLADHGAIILKVPNFGCLNRHVRGSKWCGFRFPDHVNYFTPTTLKRLATEAGYDCHQAIGDAPPLSDNMYAVLTKSSAVV